MQLLNALNFLGPIDTAITDAIASKITESMWHQPENAGRSTLSGLQECESIVLRQDGEHIKRGWGQPGHRETLANYPCFDAFATEIQAVLDTLSAYYIIEDSFMFMAKLEPGKAVGRHTDNGAFLESVRRIIIPIVTNDNVVFEVGGESYNLKVGTMHEFDNQRSHYSINNGTTKRIFLVVSLFGTLKP